MADIRKDLPMSMTMAAFIGISWYIGIEVNISLFLFFKRRRGVYFWSCALVSWGVILQPLFIILADFGVWEDQVPSIILVYLTWGIMVVPQSWVLFSRLHLLMRSVKTLRVIKLVLIFNSVALPIPTLIVGTLAQSTDIKTPLVNANMIWDRVQLIIFFIQETVLSILYIFQTQIYLRKRSPLLETTSNTHSPFRSNGQTQVNPHYQKSVLWQLIYANALIIVLDITLLGIQCAHMFNLQGAFKPCVYGIKLKVEFVILNRLINMIHPPASGWMPLTSGPKSVVTSGSISQNARMRINSDS